MVRINRELRVRIESEARDIQEGEPANVVAAKVLARLERRGDAMRYVNRRGRLAWKCSPRFISSLRDLEADAVADLDEV
jgi:hypothetical protein